MRKTIVALAMLAGLPALAAGNGMWTGELLLKKHAAGERMAQGARDKETLVDAFVYVTYVQAVIDARSLDQSVCVPPDGNAVQIMEPVAQKLRAHPEYKPLPAALVVLAVAAERWPCKSAK